MRIIKDVNIANTGSYYGSDLKTKEPFLEEVTEESLKKISLNVRQVPLTVEHNPTQQIGYISNIRKFKNKLIGDITLYLDKDIDKVVDKYISPEFVVDKKTHLVKDMIATSVVETPAISDNAKIVDNAKPYRFGKHASIKTADGDACDLCKEIQQKTNSKKLTYQQAKSRLPVHPNCRCDVKY